MKIAIVCDWLVTLGGAEKVIAEILQCYPEAHVFAVLDFMAEKDREGLLPKNITTTFIQNLPFAKKHYRAYLPLMPLAIEQLDLSPYDIILSSSHAVAKGVITGPNQLHISYVHSPMRYAWDLQHQYLRESGLDKKLRGYLARYFLHKLRLWDIRSSYSVDYFLANSQFIAKRIEKIYRRPAHVIYPPVDTIRFAPQTNTSKQNYYLTASRLVPYKRIDLIVQAFANLPDKQLIVIGDGPEFNKIAGLASRNVNMLGYQNTTTLIQYMREAKAFIFAAEEDFGIIPVEAQACGTPVIAFGKGGALETVRGWPAPSATGIFFYQQDPEHLCQAIHLFEQNQQHITENACVQQAASFHPQHFRTALQQFVADKISQHFNDS